MINYLIFGITYAFACVVQPGPLQAYLVTQSLTNGWRKSLPLALAPLMSDIPIIILILFILSNVPHEVLQILQCLGGVFLLYLAFSALKKKKTPVKSSKQNVTGRSNLLKAVIINLLNPGPYLGWSLVMGPQLIRAWNEGPGNGIVLVAGFYCSMVIYSAIMIVLFGVASNLGPRVNRISQNISVIVLIIFGSYQLWTGLTSF